MISVVICTYNGEKYIQEQLTSILEQSLSPDEVLIKDDRSSDKTEQICRSFIEENQLANWKFVINEKNLGWANNFMTAFDEVTGDIIFPCDQDDIWEKTKIEKMTKILQERQDIELLVGNYRKMVSNGDSFVVDESAHFSGEVIPIPFNEKMLFIDYPGCVFAFRKTLIEKIKPYSFDKYPHDALLLRMSRLLGTAYLYDAPVIYFRRHGGNATGTPIRDAKTMTEQINYYIRCLEELLRFCEDHNGYEKEAGLIQENLQFYRVRLNAFKNRKLIGKNSLLSCLKYLRFYPEKKSILGDCYRIIH